MAKQRKVHEEERKQVLELAKSSGLRLTQEKGDYRKISMLKQGNLEFYSNDNLIYRKMLRNSKPTVEMLKVWWKACDPLKEKDGTLGKRAYLALDVKIQKALNRHFEASRAWEIAERDWIRDAKGEETIDEKRFNDAIFELADMWTDSVKQKDYTELLNILLQSVTLEIRSGRLNRRYFLRLQDIRTMKLTTDPINGRPRWHVNGAGGADLSREALQWCVLCVCVCLIKLYKNKLFIHQQVPRSIR